MAGAGTAVSLLGMPDVGLTTADDMVRNAAMVAGLDRTVPVIADADTGFGGPVMVARLVTTKRCGHLQGKGLVDADVFASRIRATVAARKRLDDDIVIIARTDALQSRGRRCGVPRGHDDGRRDGAGCSENGGVTPLVDAQEAKRMGYKTVIWPLFALTSAYLALQKTAQELKSTGAIKDRLGPDGKTVAGSVREIFELCGLSECAEFDKEMGGKAFTDGV
ncbi:Pyruvate/Phosphoenolpyruvate kinase-like domain-containing protein [Lasiosphaeria ovina]|uniref:Pyruvate/Phosphoenolpyruvate kinase-like domain-containing protein n=1 Tax=Lasiosphaeria ovina TaxID=92902 RepID=A0AAE0NF63_9PEZI|nr:Pyruvate/Phosphoenolpyruvate kinase-like domain-containing protein [Lasiosphaeria ovina]